MKRKLRRLKNSEEAMIAGICAGWAYWLSIPTWVVRLIWAVSGIHGFGVFLYIAMWIFMPEWDEVPKDFKKVVGDLKLIMQNAIQKTVGAVGTGFAQC